MARDRTMTAGTVRQRLLLLLLKIAISLGLVAVVLWNVDTGALLATASRLTLPGALLVMLLLLAQLPFLALRWRLVARRMDMVLPMKDAFVLTWAGMFFNQSLPSSMGGDVVRAWALRRRGAAWTTAVGSVVIDRVVALLALLLMAAVALPLLAAKPGSDLLVSGLTLVLGGSVAGLLMLAPLSRWLGRLPAWLRAVDELVSATRDVLFSFQALPLLLYSLAGHVLTCVSVYVLARTLGAGLDLFDALTLVPIVILVLALPFSYAGWGLREGAMVVLLAFGGVASTGALAISFWLGLGLLLTAIPGVTLWLFSRRGSEMVRLE